MVRGCLLVAHKYSEDESGDWSETLKGNRTRLEQVMNHQHMWDLFHGRAHEVSDTALEQIAQTMASTWEHAARLQFPGSDPVAEYFPDGPEYGPTTTIHSRQPTT